MKYLIAVGGIAFAVLVAQAWYRKWSQAQPDLALEIKPPTYRYFDHDEQLAQRTQKRRLEADAIKARAHRVESGAPVSDVVLKMAKRS